MDSWSDYFHRQTTGRLTTATEEQSLYDHLLSCARTEPPEELLARFRALFINATGYSDQQVWQAVERIVNSPCSDRDFKFIFNRCCHILINHWLMQPRLHGAIPVLISLLDAVPDSPGHNRTTKHLRQLVREFQQTEQYIALKRLVQVVSQPPDYASETKPLGSLICRYPCLYEHSLLTIDSTTEERQRVRRIRRQAQRQFERELARYATCKLQLSGVQAGLSAAVQANSSSRDVYLMEGRSARNPTLLSDQRLDAALRQFGGKVDGQNTYHDLARSFLTYSKQAPCYRHFKTDLYEYLTASINPRYGRQQFNQRLYDYLQQTLLDQDNQRLNDVLLVGTCRKLLNFLVVENQQKPNHAVFIDLLGNMGIAMTVGILLKIVLICRTVKPYLEKQFAVLFQHYESHTREGVLWLVESLEHLNVAFSVNFGSLKLCSTSLLAY